MKKNHHHQQQQQQQQQQDHPASSSSSCHQKPTYTAAAMATPSSSTTSSEQQQQQHAHDPSPPHSRHAAAVMEQRQQRQQQQQQQQQPSLALAFPFAVVSLPPFSWKRRYLFCWMAISLLAIDLIRKNNILRSVVKMSSSSTTTTNARGGGGGAVVVVAAVPSLFQTRAIATTTTTTTTTTAMERNHSAEATTNTRTTSSTTTTTTTTTTTHRGGGGAPRFPWRDVLEFTLMADENNNNNSNSNKNSKQVVSATLRLCERDDILTNGRWMPTWLADGAPYITNTVHLRCHYKEYYQQVPFPSYAWSVMSRDKKKNVDNEDDDDVVDNSEDNTDDSNTKRNAAAVADASSTRSCEFTEWNWQLSCRLLSHATVLIVGDSLSWEQYSSLVQLHPQGSRWIKQGYQHQSRYLRQNIVLTVCNKHADDSPRDATSSSTGGHDDEAATTGPPVRLVFRRDDHLEYLQQAIQDDFPTVLILNRGAHFVNDTKYIDQLREKVLPIVQDWLQTCKTVYGIKCHFFWRTSVPGHAGCAVSLNDNNAASSTTTGANTTTTNAASDREDEGDDSTSFITAAYKPRYTRPNNNRTEVEALVTNLSQYDEHTLMYHWYDYQRQNILALQELESWATGAPVPFQYRIIDAYHVNILRLDDHRAHDGDCLHNCYPGKMDVYNQLLLHYLRMDRNPRVDAMQLRNVWHLLPRSGSNGTNRHHSIVSSKSTTTPYDRQAWETAMAEARNKKRSEIKAAATATTRQDNVIGDKKRKRGNDDKAKQGKKRQQAAGDAITTTTAVLQ
jgi:hypothetical protein